MTPADEHDLPAGERIDRIIADLGDWRGEALARMRDLIRDAVPAVVEEIKWVKPTNPAGVPTWSHDGIICTGEVYKARVKLTFMAGAALDDPRRPVQRQPRRRHPSRHRPPRGRRGGCGCLPGPGPGGRRARRRWTGGVGPGGPALTDHPSCIRGSPGRPHHRRHATGRDGVARPPHRAGGPSGRVPRAGRQLRRHARTARGPRRRAAPVRRQRVGHQLRTPLAITQTVHNAHRPQPSRRRARGRHHDRRPRLGRARRREHR